MSENPEGIINTYPTPLKVALMIFGGTICIGLIFVAVELLLDFKTSSSGTISTLVSAMFVGQYLSSKRDTLMPRRTRWMAAIWFTVFSLAFGAVMLGVDATLLDHQGLGLGNLSGGVLLIITLVVVVISVPLTYAGLLLGQKSAVKRAEKLAARQKAS